MKVYTKTGDKGTTTLIGGTRVAKHDSRVEAYGSVDELGAHIALLREELLMAGSTEHDEALLRIMRELMQVEVVLATDLTSERAMERLTPIPSEWVERVEEEIDQMTTRLPSTFRFTVPGGSVTIAQTHICRTVCRRAERCATAAAAEHTMDLLAQSYLNRLSDWLYTFARLLHVEQEIEEIAWK